MSWLDTLLKNPQQLQAALDDLRSTRVALERIADLLEARNLADGVMSMREQQVRTADPASVEVSYADANVIQEYADIEAGLTAARGRAPSEAEILEEYERRHPPAGDLL